MNPKILKYKASIGDLAKKLDINYLALFGSYARGEETEKSDVDMLVDFDPTIRKSLFDLIDAEDQLAKLIGKKIDLVSKTGISKYIKPYIMNDLQVIYAA